MLLFESPNEWKNDEMNGNHAMFNILCAYMPLITLISGTQAMQASRY